MNRRHFLGALAGTAALASVSAVPSLRAEEKTSRRRLLRLAHLTDTHVLPDQGAPEGMKGSALGLAKAIRHAQAQGDKPDFLFFGGDLIMDSLKQSKEATLAQWAVWEKVVSEELKLPAKYCIGNHDVWGWALHQPEIENDPHFGKALALEKLGLKDRYYSFDFNGWHFVVLDSMQRDFGNKHGYTARLDDAQFAWLAKDLAATPSSTPIAILSHIPILSSSVFFDSDLEATGTWVIPGAWMHIDARRIKDLLHKHPNVKTCLSGHVHLVDEVRYLGVKYLCHGAVCGGWWKGPYQEFGPAYALVDFYDDGSVESQMVSYS